MHELDALHEEKRLLFELTRFKEYDKQRITELIGPSKNYAWLLGQLLLNRMGGVAYYVLAQCDLLQDIPREFRTCLKGIYDINVMKTNIFKDELYTFSLLFADQPFPYAFLKGAFLSSTLYPLGLRTSNDYDILIHQKHISACEDILKNNGFVQGRFRYGQGIVPASRKDILTSRMNRGETVPFLKPSISMLYDVVEVDLNFSLDYKAKNNRDIVGEMLNEVQSFRIGGRELFTLNAVDFLIHLCVHLYKEATVYTWVIMQRDLCLYKFCDIYAFIFEFSSAGFFEDLAEKIAEYRLESACYYALKYTAAIYPCLNDIEGFTKLLTIISPANTEYLKEIIDPGGNKVYRYDMEFEDWFFCANRKSFLQDKGSIIYENT